MADQPQQINIWLESLRLSKMSETDEDREAAASKDEAILMLLAQLALGYWRPDFTAGQARQLYTSYLDSLRKYPFQDIAEAITKYKESPEKFFPNVGQLLEFIVRRPAWDVGTHSSYAAERREVAADEIRDEARRIARTKTPEITTDIPGLPTTLRPIADILRRGR